MKKNISQENVHEAQNATVNTSSQMDSKQVILQQTAQVEAVGEHATVPVRLLLDNGSQLSYITTSLRSRLKLKPVRQERLALNTFGSDSFTARGCDVVNLTLQRTDASGSWGCGAQFRDHWFQYAWPAELATVGIMAKELVPIIFRLCGVGPLLVKKDIELKCNNLGLVDAINRAPQGTRW